jgi:hypothetical protein
VIRRLGIEIPPEALEQMRFGRGVDNRRYKAAGFHYQHTSRETVVKLGEHLRLHPVVRGAQEPYRYEREVEDFLRWSPHVKNTRDKTVSALSRAQLSELQRLLTSFADTAGMDLEEDIPDRAVEAERRATAAEAAAKEAAERAGRAEEAAREHGEEAENAARRRAAEAEKAAEARAARAEKAAEEERAAGPPEHYDDLAAEEVIALLASLEHGDLQTLREYERDHANRARVLSAIDSVLARRGSRV